MCIEIRTRIVREIGIRLTLAGVPFIVAKRSGEKQYLRTVEEEEVIAPFLELASFKTNSLLDEMLQGPSGEPHPKLDHTEGKGPSNRDRTPCPKTR